jgi:hypothetical protein
MLHCSRCRKLYAKRAGQDICLECAEKQIDASVSVDEAVDRHGCITLEDIAEKTELPLSQVRKIVKSSSVLRRRVNTGEICERCQEELAQADSPYCFHCRLALKGELDDASEDLQGKIAEETAKDQNQPIGVSRMNIAQAMDDKRKLTRDSRFDPTPRGKYG